MGVPIRLFFCNAPSLKVSCGNQRVSDLEIKGMANSFFAVSNDPNQPMPPKKIKFRGKEFESVRVFSNDTLERFTHVHPLSPILFWGPAISYMFYLSEPIRTLFLTGTGAASVLLCAVMALLTWTLSEYSLHRFLFHPPMNHDWQRRVYYLLHGLHHYAPQDPTRLVMPPLAAMVISSLFYLMFRAVMGPAWALPFFGFFMIGYLIYDYTHYATHHFKMKSAMARTVKQNHMQHHYISPSYKFGVSSPLWDHIFGTLEDPAKRAAARDLKPSASV